MKEPRPALENLCCLNAQCKIYGQRGQANLTVRKTYGADRIHYLRCGCCGDEFSERKGTALFNCKIGEAQAVSVIEHLDRACSLNATAALVGPIPCPDVIAGARDRPPLFGYPKA